MFRLIGLLTCVSLAFVFPLYAYQINNNVLFDSIISTAVGTTLISVVLK
jgi:hypothetical protein